MQHGLPMDNRRQDNARSYSPTPQTQIYATNYFHTHNTQNANQGHSFAAYSNLNQYTQAQPYLSSQPEIGQKTGSGSFPVPPYSNSEDTPQAATSSWTENEPDSKHNLVMGPAAQGESRRDDWGAMSPLSPSDQIGYRDYGGVASFESKGTALTREASHRLHSVTERPKVHIAICCGRTWDTPVEGVIATKDTGTKENWISEDIANRCGLAIKKGLAQVNLTFDGSPFESGEIVKAAWYVPGGQRTHQSEFRVATNPPFDILFGNNFLSRDGHLLDEDGQPDPAFLLVQTKTKSAEQIEIEQNRRAGQAEYAQLPACSPPVNYNEGQSSNSKESSKIKREKVFYGKGGKKWDQ